MATINYALREISVKIVYYGTGLCGKTTNLQVIHRKVPTEFRSDMVSLATETDRTLFFDFLPLDLGKIKGFSTKFQLYTVPGQVYYNATRKLVLRGVDGVVFVVDSAPEKLQENIESFRNLEENLAEYGYQRENIPIILQYNKRDLPNPMPIEKLNALINKYQLPWSESIAVQGKGVFESLKLMGKLVIDNLNKKYSRSSQTPAQPERHVPVPPRPAPAQPHQMGNSGQSFQKQYPPQQPINPPRRQPEYPPQQQPPAYEDPFQDSYQQPQRPTQQRPVSPVAVQPQPFEISSNAQPKTANDYYDYGSINLEPMSPQAVTPVEVAQSAQDSSAIAAGTDNKTDLDLEIERYQREIEEKQRRQRSPSPSQSSSYQQQPMSAPMAPPAHQRDQDFEVYEAVDAQDDRLTDDQSAGQGEDLDQSADQPLYFTSVNTDRQRKKIKRPINPKTRPQGNFISKFFNKDKP